MLLFWDSETGDTLFEHEGLIVARMPKAVAEKYPELAGRMATGINDAAPPDPPWMRRDARGLIDPVRTRAAHREAMRDYYARQPQPSWWVPRD